MRWDVAWGLKRRRALMFRIQAKMNPEYGTEELRCAKCGVSEKDKQIHINHIKGRDWQPRQVASHTRTTRYMREFESGVPMNLLCKQHNGQFNPKTGEYDAEAF